jgi:formylglycine-generating enzyme required for sulfatase activity
VRSCIRLRTVAVAGGVATIGRNAETLRRANDLWAPSLVDASYSANELKLWLSKESPRFEVPIADFELGWAPVTNAEFRQFITEVGGVCPRSLILGMPDDHPVWPIPYSAAKGFCLWLSVRTGRRVRLPTEVEWEWAAGGPLHSEYPWGDLWDPALANTFESGIGDTTPVGAFPRGAALCGAVDLAGNVEELTSTLYAPYPGGEWVVDDLARLHPTGYPVLRGGACSLSGDAARSSRRHGPVPGERFQYQGFRIVVEPR